MSFSLDAEGLSSAIRKQSPRTIRLVSALLALVWLGAGVTAIVIAATTARWLPGVIGIGALWYGLLWLRVVRLGRQLTIREALTPWRIGQAPRLLLAATLGLTNDRTTLEELNRHYIRSVSEADVRWFDANLSDDFVNSNPDCSLVDKAGFLTQIGRGSTVKNLGIEDVMIRVLGDVALIHARTTYTKADGQPGAGRYTDVWMRRAGRWLCVAANVTRL